MNKFHRRIAAAVVTVMATVSTWLPTAGAGQAADVSSHPWIGEAAPDFALPKVAGGELRLKDLRGKLVVIHFGASW
jgi:cytochrome oxidase Cu insertion factor (SCO1/SenC/PrrC family)